jgi:hypothetical protein
MNKKSIYEQRKRDRERLLKIKRSLQPVNNILNQIHEPRSVVDYKPSKTIKSN